MKSLNIIFSLYVLLFSSVLKSQINEGFLFDGLQRSYITYLPSTYQQGTPMPLLMAFHGYGQSADNMMLYTQFNAIADNESFIVVYPQGVNNTWNAGLAGNSTANDVGFTNALIDTLIQKYTVNTQKIYACGLSNGGFFSYILACELGDRFAAIASVAGSMTTQQSLNCNLQAPMPILEIHGTSDLVVPYLGTTGVLPVVDLMAFWANHNNCPQQALITMLPDINTMDLSTVEKYDYQPCGMTAKVHLYKILNGGHTWPGAIPVPSLGNTNYDINASAIIWDFFKQFSKPCLNTVSLGKEPNIIIYPNPVTDKLIVDVQSDFFTEVFLYNNFGQLITYENAHISQKIELPMQHYPNGIYILKLHNGGKSVVKKIVRL